MVHRIHRVLQVDMNVKHLVTDQKYVQWRAHKTGTWQKKRVVSRRRAVLEYSHVPYNNVLFSNRLHI